MLKRILREAGCFMRKSRPIPEDEAGRYKEEYRMFRLSPFALDTERSVRSRRSAEDSAARPPDLLVSLVLEAESLLRANQELWKRIDPETTIPGLTFLAASASLDRARTLLMDAADLCGHWQEVDPSAAARTACTE